MADAEGRRLLNGPKQVVSRRVLSQRTADLMRKDLLSAVVERGTARACAIEGIPFAGKTGTAQNPPKPDHAWFVGYAPSDAPEVVFAVLVENAGHGGVVSAPIAGQLIRAYFSPDEGTQPDSSVAKQ